MLPPGWQQAVDQKGFTLVPLSAYFNQKSLLKLKVGLGRGKQQQDKREELKRRVVDREVNRQLKGFR